MFSVYEKSLDGQDLGFMVNEEGERLEFETKEKAEEFAKENCAFDYLILEL